MAATRLVIGIACWLMMCSPSQAALADQTDTPPLFDNLDLEALSEAAARHNRWEFLFVVAPIPVTNGTGSLVNPVAIF